MIFFFKAAGTDLGDYTYSLKQQIDNDFIWMLWHPTLNKIRPAGCKETSYLIWWLFKYLRVFSNQNYSVSLARHQNRIIHRTLITPRYFRFPFMEKNDLQFGDIWTDPAYRGQGIATSSIIQVANHFVKKNSKLWYIVDEKNTASIRLAEKLGFTLYGKGVRQSRLGIRTIGQYIVLDKCSSN